MGVDHIGAGQLRQELDRSARAQRRQARATLQNASIGRAGIRVYDGGWIRIEDGGLSVTGTQTVSGTLQGSGTFNWTGPMNLQGAQTITGPTTFTGQMTVNGPWKFVGNGEITGNVSLTGDLNVTGSGRIKAGNVTINPTSSGGVIEMGSGEIRGGSGIGLYPGSGPSIITSSAGVRIAFLPTISGVTPNLYVDAQGFLYRITG